MPHWSKAVNAVVNDDYKCIVEKDVTLIANNVCFDFRAGQDVCQALRVFEAVWASLYKACKDAPQGERVELACQKYKVLETIAACAKYMRERLHGHDAGQVWVSVPLEDDEEAYELLTWDDDACWYALQSTM